MRLQTNEELVIAMDTSEIVSEMLESAWHFLVRLKIFF